MNTTPRIVGRRISRSAVSIGLLICTAAWFAGAGVYYATSGSRTDWSATPLSWMLVVMVCPSICFSGGMILVDARKHSRLSRLDWFALAAASFPVILGTLLAAWVVTVMFSMIGPSA